MPILPDSPPARSGGGIRTYSGVRQIETISERPLFQTKSASPPPVAAYARPTGVLPVVPAYIAQPPSPGEQARRHFAHLKNVESAASVAAAGERSPRPRRILPEKLYTEEAPLMPFHLRRHVHGGRDTDAEIVGELRAGIGFAHAGDKSYDCPEHSTGFWQTSAQPSKWRSHAHAGAAAAAAGVVKSSSAVGGRSR